MKSLIIQDFTEIKEAWDKSNGRSSIWFMAQNICAIVLLACVMIPGGALFGIIPLVIGFFCSYKDVRGHWKADTQVLKSQSFNNTMFSLNVLDKLKHFGTLLIARQNRPNLVRTVSLWLFTSVVFASIFVATGGTAFFVLSGIAALVIGSTTLALLAKRMNKSDSYNMLHRFMGMTNRIALIKQSTPVKHHGISVADGHLESTDVGAVRKFGPDYQYLLIHQSKNSGKDIPITVSTSTTEDKFENVDILSQWTCVDKNQAIGMNVQINGQIQSKKCRLFQSVDLSASSGNNKAQESKERSKTEANEANSDGDVTALLLQKIDDDHASLWNQNAAL